MITGLRTFLRRTLAGARHAIVARRRGEAEGLVPAFDPTMPTATAQYRSSTVEDRPA